MGHVGPVGSRGRDRAPRRDHLAADVAVSRCGGLPARRPSERPGRCGMSDPQDDGLSIPSDYVANLFDLSGRVAVITGGGSGLGRAIAIGYAQAGVYIVAADVNDDGAAETARQIQAQGGGAE